MIDDWKGNSKIGNDCTNPQEPRHNNSFKQLEMQICVIEFMGLHLLFSLRCECKYVWIITALQPPRLRIAAIPCIAVTTAIKGRRRRGELVYSCGEIELLPPCTEEPPL